MKIYVQYIARVLLTTLLVIPGITLSSELSAYHQSNQDPGKIVILVDNSIFTCYRFNEGQKYPYFYPVNGPVSNVSLTTDTGVPYDHHRSLWFGCDRVNGGNYWQEGTERGQIVSQGAEIIVNGPEKIHIKDECEWKQPGKAPVIQDTRDYVITAPGDSLRIMDITITLNALTDIKIEKTNHSLLSVRMKKALSVSEGGTLMNSAGQQGEKETAGSEADWCDYSGDHFKITEGIAIFNSPKNIWSPSKWFTRDYGFFSPTNMNFLDEGLSIDNGKSLTFSYRIIVHTEKLHQVELQKLYDSWVSEAK